MLVEPPASAYVCSTIVCARETAKQHVKLSAVFVLLTGIVGVINSLCNGVLCAALGLMEDAAVPQGQYLLQVSFVLSANDEGLQPHAQPGLRLFAKSALRLILRCPSVLQCTA